MPPLTHSKRSRARRFWGEKAPGPRQSWRMAKSTAEASKSWLRSASRSNRSDPARYMFRRNNFTILSLCRASGALRLPNQFKEAADFPILGCVLVEKLKIRFIELLEPLIPRDMLESL